MTRPRWLACALTAAMLLGWTAVAGATPADPQRIAGACTAKVARLAKLCIAANAKDAKHTVARIEVLLEHGRKVQAVRLGRRAVERINRRSDACVRRIRRLCRRCVDVLERLGQPELAERVRSFCRDKIRDVRRSQRAAIEKIHQALRDAE